jgi:hypothetical protein
MRKIIFLDIDGVIATPETIIGGGWGITPKCENMLAYIIKNTNAEIVLTSSWRLPTLEETISYMTEHGFHLSEHITGVTIRAYKYLDKTSKIHLSIPRGVEIKQWIDTHLKYPWYAYPERQKEWEILNPNGSFKMMKSGELRIDYSYVILDDDCDMLLEHIDRFLRCDPMIGLDKQLADEAIKILEGVH